MSAIVDPRRGRSHPFAGRDCRCVAHRRYLIAVTARLDAQNAEAVLGVMECHAFDVSSEYLAPLIPMLLTHVIISIRSYRIGVVMGTRSRIYPASLHVEPGLFGFAILRPAQCAIQLCCVWLLHPIRH